MAAGTLSAPDPDQLSQPPPAMPPIQGAPAPLAATPSQPASPGAGAPQQGPPAPTGTLGAQPNGIENARQKGQINTGPKAEFDPKKLATAQTTLDLINAMKPQSRTDYMDWWQKQHGDIDEKYDQLKQSIGARPSDDEPQTQKEKFAALLEFGLHLMKGTAAAVGSSNQAAPLANAVSDSVEDAQKSHQASITAAQGQYDTQANAIEEQRQKELQGIGTPAAAMKEQTDVNRQDAENLKDTASAYKDVDSTLSEKGTPPAKTYSTGQDGGLYSLEPDESGNPVAKPVMGIDGKPYRGSVLGRATGSGIAPKDTAQIRNYNYLTSVLKVDPNTANTIAFRPPTGNSLKDHASIYKAAMTATMGDTDKAKAAADQYVLDNYGAGELSRATAPAIPPAAKPGGAPTGGPPPQALQGLKPGMARALKGPDGTVSKWTVDIEGNPIRVGATAPIQ
jgi:hypothetical protein